MAVQKSDIETFDQVIKLFSAMLKEGENLIITLNPDNNYFLYTKDLTCFDDLYGIEGNNLDSGYNIMEAVISKKFNYQ